MRFLRSEKNAPKAGAAVPLAAVWELSQGWYGDRLEPGYRPSSTDRLQKLLGAVGLTGEFWELGGR
jgi:hypothetical protein